MSRILLFNPPHPQGKGFTREGRCTQEAGVWATQWPPLSLATTAALLSKGGHRLKVIDCPATGLNQARLYAITRAFQPEFALWNTASPTLGHDLSMAGLIRRAAPNVITGVMGTHVSALPEAAFDDPEVDTVIRREPEQTIAELCGQKDRPWTGIKGLSYRDRDKGCLHHNADRDFYPPEDIPAPAWGYLDTRPYRLPLKGRPFLIVAPVRGCPYPCNFCTAPVYYGKRLRKRPVPMVVDEIEANLKQLAVRDFFVWADTFTADKEYVKQFCAEIIQRGLKISWTCNSRVDTVDRDVLAQMKAAGAWMISFGLESGNDAVLARTGKKITVNQSRRAVALAHQVGIKTSGHFILGLPGETESSLHDTLRLALALPLDIAQFYTAAPFPGTRLYRQALKQGWLRTHMPASQGQAVLSLPGLPAHRVDAFRRYAFRRFYGRPGVMLNLLSMTRPGAMVSVLGNLRRFLGWARTR